MDFPIEMTLLYHFPINEFIHLTLIWLVKIQALDKSKQNVVFMNSNKMQKYTQKTAREILKV